MQADCTVVKEIDGALLAAEGVTLQAFKDELRSFGDDIQAAVEHGTDSDFSGVQSLHFLSVCVIDDANYFPQTPRSEDDAPQPRPDKARCLSLEISCDGKRKEYLTELATHCQATLEKIMRFCRGFAKDMSVAQWIQWLERDIPNSLYYVANSGRTRSQILAASATTADEKKLLATARESTARLQHRAPSRVALWDMAREEISRRHPDMWSTLVMKPVRRPWNVVLTRSATAANCFAWLFQLLLLLSVPLGVWGMRLWFVPAANGGSAILDGIPASSGWLWTIGYLLLLLLPLIIAVISFVDSVAESPRNVRAAVRLRIVLGFAVQSVLQATALYLVIGVATLGIAYVSQFMQLTLWIFAAALAVLASVALVVLLQVVFGNIAGLIAALVVINLAGVWPAFSLARKSLAHFDASSYVFQAFIAFCVIWVCLLLLVVFVIVFLVLPMMLRTRFGALKGSLLAVSVIAVYVAIVVGGVWLIAPYVSPQEGWPPSAPRLLVYLVLSISVIIGVLGLVLAGLAYYYRRVEESATVSYRALRTDHMDKMRHRENRVQQSHFASVTDIRKTGVRPLKMAFRLIRLGHMYYYNRGYLSTIPSIHFARWLVIPGNRLLFLTNFDGEFDGYLGDFQNVEGVNLIWGSTVGFPRVYLLILDGARSEQLFKDHARNSQVESLVWYSAYPNLTVQEIDRATTVREALAREPDRLGNSFADRLRRAWTTPIGDAEIARLLREELQVQ